jgi:NADPH:quinone reductase-like Zn-dependent oxidoreductase
MQAYLIDSVEGIDAIKRVERPDPQPLPGEVLVRIRANALNRRDLNVARGGYPGNDTRPVIPLSDAAGEVIAVGEGVTRLQPGDRVVASHARDWVAGPVTDAAVRSGLGGGVDGTLAELVSLP